MNQMLALAEKVAGDVLVLLGGVSSKELKDLKGQLRRSISSAPWNIAEGLGRFAAKASRKDRDRFFGIALGSLREAESQLRVLSKVAGVGSDALLACLELDKTLCDEFEIKPEAPEATPRLPLPPLKKCECGRGIEKLCKSCSPEQAPPWIYDPSSPEAKAFRKGRDWRDIEKERLDKLEKETRFED